MTTQTRQTIIPSTERRLARAGEGDILEEHYNINFIGHPHNKDIYDGHVQKLKQADLWMD